MTDDTKKCPFCGEEIKIRAIKCKHCGEFLDKTSKKSIKSKVLVISLCLIVLFAVCSVIYVIKTFPKSVEDRFVSTMNLFEEIHTMDMAIGDANWNTPDNIIKSFKTKLQYDSTLSHENTIILKNGTSLTINPLHAYCRNVPIDREASDESACAEILINVTDKKFPFMSIAQPYSALAYKDRIVPRPSSRELSAINRDEY